MLSSHTVGFQRPDNSNLANLTPGMCSSSWSCENTAWNERRKRRMEREINAAWNER